MGFTPIDFSRLGHRQQLQISVSCMKCMQVELAGSFLLEWFHSSKLSKTFIFSAGILKNYYFLIREGKKVTSTYSAYFAPSSNSILEL